MDAATYVAFGTSVVILLVIVAAVLKKYFWTDAENDLQLQAADVRQNQGNVGARPRPLPAGAAPVRRRNRLRAPRRPQDDSDGEFNISDEDEEEESIGIQVDGKVGAKKLRKLEEKAARKAQREAEEQERRERKEREEKLEKKRKKEEELEQQAEAAKAAEEQKLKEEQARREYEEYLKLKETFTVDEEGTDAVDEQDVQSLLQEFIQYIEQTKVVMLEDLAAHFKIRTQDAIDRVKTLQDEGRLSGVIDDRGKFICITSCEYDAVARFIKQRGRVSISELADSMNRLIRLNSETPSMLSVAKDSVCGQGISVSS